MSPQDPTPEPTAPAGRSYEAILTDAVRALTEAGRRTWSRVDDTGRTVTAPCDWAEFVTHALAGAAANLGGIEASLTGRPGSWEADGVRTLLTGTVGDDEQYLLEHRTEPVEITLYVDEIMVELGVWKAYDDAQQEIARRSAALGLTRTTMPTDADPLVELTPEQEEQATALDELDGRLDEQRLNDWADYAQLLKANVEGAGGRREGLSVPVIVNVDLDSFRPSGTRGNSWGLAEQLVDEAIQATPLPGDGRPPLDRLGS